MPVMYAPPQRWYRKGLFACACAVFLVASLPAANPKRDLGKDSPFLPPGYRQHLEQKNKKPPPPPKPPPRLKQNLEWRGSVRIGGVWRFSIFDKRTNKGQWIILNDLDRIDGIFITNFDYEKDEIDIEQDGHKESITMARPSGTIVPIAHLKAAPRKPATVKASAKTVSKPTAKPKPPVVRQRIVTPR